MNKSLRWFAVLPSAVLAWSLAFFISLYVLGAAENYFCPADFLTSSGCYAPWWSDVERGAAAFGGALAAVLVVAISTIVAPAQKRRVAWYSFGVGAVLTIFIGLFLSFILQMVATLVAGAITAAVISRGVSNDA